MSSGPTCPKCGRINRPGVKFCAACGTPLPAVPPQPSAPAQSQQPAARSVTPQSPPRSGAPQPPPRPAPVTPIAAPPAARRAFSIQPLYLAIAAAAAIGVLLCVALFILFGASLGIGGASPTATVIAFLSPTALQTSTPLPTNTAIPATATPFKETVVVTAVVIVTATIPPTETRTPIPPTNTNTPEPTVTPIPHTATPVAPTATPMPSPTQPPPLPTNTSSGTTLVVGQPWSQDGMMMMIPSSNFASLCNDVVLEFPVEIRNTTDQQIVISFTTNDLKMEDDRPAQYSIDFRLGVPDASCGGYTQVLEKNALAPNEAYLFTVRARGSTIPQGANEMIFTVNKAGRIHDARWKFPITR